MQSVIFSSVERSCYAANSKSNAPIGHQELSDQLQQLNEMLQTESKHYKPSQWLVTSRHRTSNVDASAI
jgi:hypothetical protein